MQEEFLHFIWSERLYNTDRLKTVNGEDIYVEDPGMLNELSGPDFHESKVRIGDTLWAGSVEIHIKSSDWFKHNHEPDKAYGNVILHVVFEHDLIRDGFNEIPILELKGRITRNVLNKYGQLKKEKSKIPCESLFGSVAESVKYDQLERSAIQRLQRKAGDIKLIYEKSKGDIDQTFFTVLAKNFGFKWNAPAFEELAARTPYSVIQKYTHDLFKLEALLLGQGGFLPVVSSDPEVNRYSEEYLFLKNKHELIPCSIAVWKRGGVRPPNFPEIRLAQLAAFLNQTPRAATDIESWSVAQALEIFNVTASDFWNHRYTLSKASGKKSKKQIARGSRNNMLINTVAPFLYFKAQLWDKPEFSEKAILLQENIPAENNSVISKWKSLHLTMKNALHSQGALNLYNELCKKKKCLNCEIGKKILR